jgi:hypothetical protein
MSEEKACFKGRGGYHSYWNELVLEPDKSGAAQTHLWEMSPKVR